MKHFQSKVLTAAILATFCSGALAATNDDDVKKAATVAIAAAYNNGQEINGFKAGETIYDIGEDGTITKKDATAADVEADDFKGLGLKKVVTNLTKTVNENKQNVDAKVKAAETAAGKAEAAAGTANTAADKAEAVAAKVTDIKADIATNKDNIAKKANSADVYTREESDSKFVRIDGLNATTEKLDTRLASAEKSIADHDTRLNGLDKTVSDLRKETRQGLAEQARALRSVPTLQRGSVQCNGCAATNPNRQSPSVPASALPKTLPPKQAWQSALRPVLPQPTMSASITSGKQHLPIKKPQPCKAAVFIFYPAVRLLRPHVRPCGYGLPPRPAAQKSCRRRFCPNTPPRQSRQSRVPQRHPPTPARF